MGRNDTIIEALGLWCPSGGKPYVCEGAYYEFVGCCTYDPCADYSGRCDLPASKPSNTTNLAQFAKKEWFICRNDNYTDRYWGAWSNIQTTAPDGVNISCQGSMPTYHNGKLEAVGTMTGQHINARSLTPYKELRDEFFRFVGLDNGNTVEGAEPTGSPLSGNATASETHNKAIWGSLAKMDIIGLSIGISVFSLFLLALLGRYFWISQAKKYKYFRPQSLDQESTPRAQTKRGTGQQSSVEVGGGIPEENSPANSLHQERSSWHRGQQSLNQKDFSWYGEFVWDVILTIAPIFFIVVPVLALCLNNQPLSSHGEDILRINRLIPTIYPILFAAVAARFYKNLGRWHLEQPDGIRLAVLEQIMGSQSFAGALERLLFVRTQVAVGLIILVIWAMSPLGGQAGARMVYNGQNEILSRGNVYYTHPSYQVSSYSSMEFQYTTELSVKSLYQSSLLQSPDQKGSPRDLWEMPKIPQRDKSKAIGEMYEIDHDELERGDNEYYSLLGTKVQGLDFTTQSDAQLTFSIESSYLDFGCTNRFEVFNASTWLKLWREDPLYSTLDLMKGQLNGTSFWVQFSGGYGWEFLDSDWDYMESWAPPHLVYMSKRADLPASMIMFNCSMDTVVLETEIKCGLDSKNPSCSAVRQRLVDAPERKLTLMRQTMKSGRALRNLVMEFPEADGAFYNRISSATDAYVAGDSAPYSKEGIIDWNNYDLAKVSRRLTSAFNTWHMATLNPQNHTAIAFREDPGRQKYWPLSPSVPTYYNSTQGSVSTRVEVYRVDKLWTTIHLFTTFTLLILSALGLAFRLLIRGPDVVGFASSMTRDNSHVPLEDCGSALPGAKRARLLKDLRVQLADVLPEKDVGYIAFRNVPSHLEGGDEIDENEEQKGSWRPFMDGRLYK